jgi:Fe-S cluster assembly protein SufD
MNGEAASGLHTLRREALELFSRRGYPSTHEEEWRFTSVSPIAAISFRPALHEEPEAIGVEELEPFVLGGVRSHLVFVNGHYARSLSVLPALAPGVRIMSLAEALEAEPNLVLGHLTRHSLPEMNAFAALNTAFLQDGAFLSLPDGTVLEEPIHLLFLSRGKDHPFIQTPRNLIVAGNDTKLTIVETYHSLGKATSLTSVVSEIVGGEHSTIEHDKLQQEALGAYHVGTTHVRLAGGSTFISNSVTLGASLARNMMTVSLEGEGSECTLNGLSLGTGKQLIDNHTTIDHARAHCTSHELYKAIHDGKSHGVFNGKIFVRKDAQKTDAKQTNKTLILSDDATMNTKPQLEIFADDVKCTHGATVGQLEEEQLFYLRSRGISLEEARDLLTFAFASDVIDRVHVDALRKQLDTLLRARLRQGRLRENA